MTYVYRCKRCSHEFEATQRMTDDPLTDCESPDCDGKVKRVPQPTGFILKGVGNYGRGRP